MASRNKHMQPPEARAFRIQGTGATVAGTTNTNVVAFTAAAATWQGTKTSKLGATFVAPTSGSDLTYNVVNDAAMGTAIKICRRGIYRAQISADNTIADVAAAQLGITLDQALALYTVAAGTVSALSDSVLGYTVIDSLADQGTPCVVSADVYITDAQAAGAQPVAATGGVQGVGVLRFIANNNGNAVVATAFIVASIRATVAWVNDLAG